MESSLHVQVLDAGLRGAANMEAMSCLSAGKKGKLHFFSCDEEGTHIGSHTVYTTSMATSRARAWCRHGTSAIRCC